MKLSRRGLFQGIFGAAIAPLAAKVAAALPPPQTIEWKTLNYGWRTSMTHSTWRMFHQGAELDKAVLDMLSQSNEIFDDLPYTGESTMHEWIECPTCEGTGEYEDNICPTCDGRGEIEAGDDEEKDDVE